MLIDIMTVLNFIVLCALLIISLGYLVLMAGSIRDVLLRFQEVKLGDVHNIMKTHVMPPVTAIIPAYNEEEIILESVQSVLNSDYPNTFVTVINDGSTDKTLEILIKKYDLHKTSSIIPQLLPTKGKVNGFYISNSYKNLIVIDKEHTDKGDSLNIGLNSCRTPLFMTVDGDTLLDPDALSEVVFYMMVKPHAVAVSGSVYILNGCNFNDGKINNARIPRQIVPALQACEYLRSFVINRTGWNMLGGALCFAGAFSLFEHKAVIEIGGYDTGNPANDFEIITHLHAHKLDSDTPYQIGFTPAASAWTYVPKTLGEFWKQRSLWQWGIIRSLMLHKNLFFNPRYKMIGLFSYPFYFIVEALGAFIELAAYLLVFLSWYLGVINVYVSLLFFLACWLFITFLTMSTVLISFVTYNKYQKLRDLPFFIFLVTLDSFGFRQYHVLCRVIASLKYLFTWGKVEDHYKK